MRSSVVLDTVCDISNALYAFDPGGCFCGNGAPLDEYDSEAVRVFYHFSELKRTLCDRHLIDALAGQIHAVFVKSFSYTLVPAPVDDVWTKIAYVVVDSYRKNIKAHNL